MAQINISNTGTSGIETPQTGVVAIFSNSADSGRLYYKFADGTTAPVDTGGGGGTAGTAGTSGTSGTSGLAGAAGAPGTSGTSGLAGAPGTSGTSGVAGTPGTSGTSGTSGEGTSGTSGIGIPAGGNTNQVLAKIDGTDYNTQWVDQTGGGGATSGTSGTSGSGTSGTSGTSGLAGAPGTSGTSGVQGLPGTSGTSGEQGLPGTSGTSGTSGEQGLPGTSGTSGEQGLPGTSGTSGEQGLPGTSGTSGEQGLPGTSGTSGEQGLPGTSGTSGEAGTSGTSGEAGTSGTSGEAGTSGTSGTSGAGSAVDVTDGITTVTAADKITFSGATVTDQGNNDALVTISGGGGGGISTVYNNEVRYVAIDSTQYAEIKSSGTLYAGLSWSRSGATITITSTAHGLTTGDYVVVRNMGATDYVYGAISNVSTNAFDITNAVNSGDTSGTSGAYIPAAKVTSIADDAATISSPSAGNIQISYVKIVQSGGQFSTNFTLTMPTGINNGVGGNTNFKSQGAPIAIVYTNNGAYNSSATPNIKSTTGADFDEIEISAGLTTFVQNMLVFQF